MAKAEVHKFVKMLIWAGIEHEITRDEKDEINEGPHAFTVKIEREAYPEDGPEQKNIDGYDGFYVKFYFNALGRLQKVGLYE